jgi:hypothetical protein
MKEILVVGNGPSLLGSKLGSTIDQFPQVVRFNGYEVGGFQADVGSKTTIWSRWYGLPTMRPMDQLDSIWINMPVNERTPEKLAKAKLLLGNNQSKATIIPRLEIATMLQRALFGGNHPTKWPSSGLLAIAHAIDCGYDVWIAGIDSWAREPFHYYGPHDRSGTHHVAELERDYLAQLIRADKVQVLNAVR